MLACIGPVIFDIANDLQSIDEESASRFARHDVLGTSPVYEDTGDDEGTFTLKGTLLPHFFADYGRDALAGIKTLEVARKAKMPLPFMGGDFVPRGFVLINKIARSDGTLNPFDGIGAEVEFTLDLLKAGDPGAGLASTVLRIFL